jgi:ribose 1,5-bisphosphokinase
VARNALFKDRRSSDEPVHLIDNSGALAGAVNQLLDWVKINATPDQI